MKVDRKTLAYFTVCVLLVIHLFPVWGIRYFPTQDGASHIYNAYILKEYHKHENYRLREVYELNKTLFPNWTSHVLLASLMYIFPPIVCEKIVLSLCIGLLPLSLFYFLNNVQKNNILFGFVGFIFAYNYLLHMGFYNFVLSMSLYFFTLGYWWKVKDNINWKRISVIYIFLIATYFTHYHSYALLLISLTVLLLFSSLYNYLQKTFSGPKMTHTLMQRLKEFGIKLKPSLLFALVLLPAYCILFTYYIYLVHTHGSEGDHRGFEWLINYFLSMKSLVSFRDEHVLIGQILLIAFAISIIITVINRMGKYRNQSESSGLRHWIGIITITDGFLILTALVTALYFMSPWSGYSGGWINDRFHIYIFLILLPFFSMNLHRYINYIMTGVIILLSLLHIGYNVHTYTKLNHDITNALSLEGINEKHTILSSFPGEWGGMSDSLGYVPKYVEPFGHIECLLIVEMGIAYLNNYEANTDHFPLRYKQKELPSDYIIVWRTEYDDVEGLEEEYDLIDSNEYNRLYKQKRIIQDPVTVKDEAVYAFDMQPNGAQTIPGYIPVHTDTNYTDGKYGWLTKSVKSGYKGDSQEQQLYDDSIMGKEDAVFRVTLPNGTYEVICYFGGSESNPLEVNLLANGERRIKELYIPVGSKGIEERYIINVIDEQLTQVIYKSGKGRNRMWVWSGFTIKSIDDNILNNLREETEK
ncbi:MAG: hypothetical protein OXD54_06425 [Candidatus Poribacteria bacterium]|nr:hypothetical protein [Candidatus Poribacteria bacterium]